MLTKKDLQKIKTIVEEANQDQTDNVIKPLAEDLFTMIMENRKEIKKNRKQIKKNTKKIDLNSKKIDKNRKKIELNSRKIDVNTSKIDKNTEKLDRIQWDMKKHNVVMTSHEKRIDELEFEFKKDEKEITKNV